MNECVWKIWWNDMDRPNQSTWSKNCPSAIWFTTNPTGTGLELNLGLYRKRPVTNCLSLGTAIVSECLSLMGITVIF